MNKYVLIFFISICTVLCSCSDENTVPCNPAECESPDHAASMACDENLKCIVKTCEEGFAVTSDMQNCAANSASSCVDSECPVAANAKTMKCSEQGCIVQACNEHFDISEDKKSCTARDDYQCNPTDCEKPDHASEMACAASGCVVKSCETGFDVAKDYKSCQKIESTDPPVENKPDPEPEHKCKPENCPKPSYAEEMKCSEDGQCLIQSCNDGHDVSEDGLSCVCPQKHKPCKKPGERRCCEDSEFECGANWIWYTNVCSEKLKGGYCGTYTMYDKGRKDVTYACFVNTMTDVDRGEVVCSEDTLKQRVVSTSCIHPPESPTVQFYFHDCNIIDNDQYAFTGNIGAISLCKDKNTMYECDQTTYKVISSPCNACQDSFTGHNYLAKCQASE